MTSQRIHLPLFFTVLICIGAAGLLGFNRLDIDTDISKFLPAGDPVIADALEIFQNHPIHDQVAVDIMVDRDAPDILVSCAKMVEEKMRASGLFAQVGMGDVAKLIPEVAQHVARNLPLLFSATELGQQVAPRLAPARVASRLEQLIAEMGGLEGLGQSGYISTDPLDLKGLILAKLAHLAPSHNGRFYKGHLISADSRHLLLISHPALPGANTRVARKLVSFFAQTGRELNDTFAAANIKVTLTPTGTYRAALDNEEIIRHDVQLALGLSTAGIAFMLILAFPRPLLSLLALVPPLAGITVALFVYSLFHSSISIMVLGFSGALISVMDDFSITYLLFLDRPRVASSKKAAIEVQAIGGFIALTTTIASFLILSLSDFPIFKSLGEFTALGLAFTYLFIYFICPKLFPELAPSVSPRRTPPLHRLSTQLFNGGKAGLIAACCLGGFMLLFAKPQFHLSLSDMNTMSSKTLAANRMLTEVWGNIDDQVFLMNISNNRRELQEHNDRLEEKLNRDLADGRITSAFNPSMIFPGQAVAEKNLRAWTSFWTAERVQQLQGQLLQTGAKLGFTDDAFKPFLKSLQPTGQVNTTVPGAAYDMLLGISSNDSGELVQFISVTPGSSYDSTTFLKDYGTDNTIFDGKMFSNHLAGILFSTFISSLYLMLPVISLMVFLYYLNLRLTLLTLLPLAFALICTLGTLNLLSHPLDIPGLMLTVVIFGLGIDYTIYTVCGRQRYGSKNHESYVLVRSAVVLSAASTLIGFGVLCLAEHATLKSVGITSLCGIGYSFLGTILILPPLLEKVLKSDELVKTQSCIKDSYVQKFAIHGAVASTKHRRTWTTPSIGRSLGNAGDRTFYDAITPEEPPNMSAITNNIIARYRHLEAYPRMFVRGKLALDPLLQELGNILNENGTMPARILDIGCGYGVPACWCLERFPGCRVVGIEPDAERVRVARRAVGDSGTIMEQAAPNLPASQAPFNLIMLLDMLHYLNPRQLEETMSKSAALLNADGRLVTRFAIKPAARRPSLFWRIEDRRTRRRAGIVPTYHPPDQLIATMTKFGFLDVRVEPSNDPELLWLSARAT